MRATNERTARQIQNGGGWINPPTFIYLMMIFFFFFASFHFFLFFILFFVSPCGLEHFFMLFECIKEWR